MLLILIGLNKFCNSCLQHLNTIIYEDIRGHTYSTTVHNRRIHTVDETYNVRHFNIPQTTNNYRMDTEENKLPALITGLEL